VQKLVDLYVKGIVRLHMIPIVIGSNQEPMFHLKVLGEST
jgi:hypothetical protein